MNLVKSADMPVPGSGLEHDAAERFSKTRLSLAMTAATLLILSVQVGLVVHGSAPVLDGILVDPDAYMRLSRVERLWDTGLWYDPVFSRIDPPNGLALHWTRPMDVLLLLGAWLATPLVGFDSALYWWGVFISPVLQIVSLVGLLWAAAPLLPSQWRSWAAFLFALQPGIFVSFLVGRPDHHGLLAVLTIILLGLTIRILLEPERRREAVWFGVVAAIAVWVSVESLVIVSLAIASLGLFWLLGDRRVAHALVVTASALFAALVVALIVERGPGGFGEIEIDRLSSAHLTLFAINLLFWMTVEGLERRGSVPLHLGARIGWTTLGLAAALGALALLQPAFFVNPLDSGDALYTAKHLAHIEELQPLLGAAATNNAPWPLASALLWLGIAVPAVPWLIYRISGSTGPQRRAWVFLGLGALALLPMAIVHRRWALYPEIFLLIPYAALAGAAVDALAARLPRGMIRLFRLPIICALCLWFYVPTVASNSRAEAAAASDETSACPISAVAPTLNDPDGLGASPKRVMAFVDFGPELLYRTPHSVFSIPNHRNQPGFATTYEVMTATDLATARKRLEQAQVDLILICPFSAESWFYEIQGRGPTFHRMLSDGDVPEFLEAAPLPEGIAELVKLFRVR